MATLVNSSGFTLMWGAPPAEDQNGVIRYYAIHIIEITTSQEHTLNSTETQTEVYFLHPYYNYTYAVSAVTIELGPYTTATNIRTSEDGTTICKRLFSTRLFKLFLEVDVLCYLLQHLPDLPLMLMPLLSIQPL